MRKEELEELKKQLKKEILNEMGERKSIWIEYSKHELDKLLEKKYENPRTRYQCKSAILTLVRTKLNIKSIQRVNSEELNQAKEVINNLIEVI